MLRGGLCDGRFENTRGEEDGGNPEIVPAICKYQVLVFSGTISGCWYRSSGRSLEAMERTLCRGIWHLVGCADRVILSAVLSH